MASRSYLQLVRENREFRQLWIAAVISMLGEWFNTIALFFLILEYTGSEFLLGMLFTVRMAGFAILQPFIGLLADRYNRKMLMVVSNLLQAGFALCFLLVNDSSDIVWMIGLSGLMMVLHGVYMTAERAALPNLVSEEDLATANALDAASWSTALCLGAMLGGIVVSIWGTEAAFIVDSITFLIGTLFLVNLTIPQTIDDSMRGPVDFWRHQEHPFGVETYSKPAGLVPNCVRKSILEHRRWRPCRRVLGAHGSGRPGLWRRIWIWTVLLRPRRWHRPWPYPCEGLFEKRRSMALPRWLLDCRFRTCLLHGRRQCVLCAVDHRTVGHPCSQRQRCKLGLVNGHDAAVGRG